MSNQTIKNEASSGSFEDHTPKRIAILRLGSGYVLMAGSLWGAIRMIRESVAWVENFRFPILGDIRVETARLVAHSILAVAFLALCSKVFGAGERLIVPSHLIRNTDDLRLILGADQRLGGALSVVKKAVNVLEPLIKSKD